MRKALILPILFPILIFSQSHIKSPTLRPISELIKYGTIDKTVWELVYIYEKEDEVPLHPDSAQRILSDWLSRKDSLSKDDSILYSKEEVKLIKNNSNDIVNIMKSMNFIGGNLCLFTVMNSDLPVRFANKNGQKALLVHGIATDDILNTFKLGYKERVSKIINKYCLSALSNIQNANPKIPVKYYGVSVVYGSKDFSSDEEALNLKSEIVYMISPVEMCKKYSAAEITDVEFIKGSEIYGEERGEVGIKKIDISSK